jgi:hypothetical protein
MSTTVLIDHVNLLQDFRLVIFIVAGVSLFFFILGIILIYIYRRKEHDSKIKS